MLSKTNFLRGLQCYKYLWTVVHEPKSIPPPDAVTQFTFDQGHEVGELAKKLFPTGIDIPTGDFSANIKITRENMLAGRPLFEAGMLAGNIFCRPDILNPVGAGEWDIIEVKSSTGVKDVNIWDVAFQRLCCESLGMKIRTCNVARINNQYVRQGEIDPQQLFIVEDITTRVNEYSEGLSGRVDEIVGVMSRQQCPEVGIGPYCSDPYPCPLQAVCWESLPEHSIFDLYYGGKKCFELFESGVTGLADIPADYELNGKQQIQVDCVSGGREHVDRQEIRSFLDSLQYPIHYLDFETFGSAVPLLDGTRPYQSIPFQFSVHIVPDSRQEVAHFSYLADGTDDPRPALAARLREVLGDSGSIVAYSAIFEKNVLRDLAGALPEYQDWVDGLQDRIVDLLKPFSNFHYYHPEQKGSASLKNVMPALTGISYEGLTINDGRMAAAAYMSSTYGDVTEEDRKAIRQALEEYCGQDTGGMVEIINRLMALAGQA
ncbi:MAG: DUF2779 domain-containing protein [Chloroflexi bacterium]|nr:DUF2779 domain-containing protein [Chloroflexota bacterium]